MSETARSRINADLKREAEAVLKEIGLTPRAALELFDPGMAAMADCAGS